EQLVAALDDWSFVAWAKKDTDLHQRLLHVARLVDSDPRKDQLRHPDRWNKPAATWALARKVLADRSTLAQWSPPTLRLMGSLLPEGEQRLAWLQVAQRQHEADFWLNFDLGVALVKTQPQRAEAFYRAALVIRPKSPAVLNNLGRALIALKD